MSEHPSFGFRVLALASLRDAVSGRRTVQAAPGEYLDQDAAFEILEAYRFPVAKWAKVRTAEEAITAAGDHWQKQHTAQGFRYTAAIVLDIYSNNPTGTRLKHCTPIINPASNFNFTCAGLKSIQQQVQK